MVMVEMKTFWVEIKFLEQQYKKYSNESVIYRIYSLILLVSLSGISVLILSTALVSPTRFRYFEFDNFQQLAM